MERTRAELTELLGSDAYFSHPQPTDETFYLRNSIKRVENTQVFLWDQTVDGIPVESHQLTVIATEEGILGFTLRWGVLEPLDAPMPDRLLTAEDALYSLNYARSQQSTGAALSTLEKILHVQLVYSSRFAERPNLYQPAWQFALANAENAETDIVLVDAATGDVFSDHDGWMDSAYPKLSSRPVEMAKLGISNTEAEALLKEYVETAWNSVYSLTVPALPEFAMETVENAFNYRWAEYRIQRIRQQAPNEQATAPPTASVTVKSVSADGIEVRMIYDCTVLIQQQGEQRFSFTDSAVFVFRKGRWMLRRAGLIWDGQSYEKTYYSIRQDGPLSAVDAAVRRKIENMENSSDAFALPGERR